MTRTTTKPRPANATRRAGYVVAVLVNAALVYVFNVQPGWEDMSFLTQDTSQVLWWVNLSLTAGIVANLLYLIHDARRVKALGDVVTTALGLVGPPCGSGRCSLIALVAQVGTLLREQG